MANHELWLTDDKGGRIALLDDFISFEGTIAVNTVGQCKLYLPSTFDTSLLRIDRMLQLWRAPKGGTLKLWRPFLIQRIRYAMNGAEETIEVGGEDPNTLLKRRVIMGYKGSPEAEKSDYLDDMMKAYVNESMVVSAYTPGFGSRNYTGLTIQRDLSKGAQAYHEAAFRNLYKALQALASKNREFGASDLFFDVVPTFVTGTSISFEFRTYVGQIGADLSNYVVFDPQDGNFTNPFFERDWSDVQSYVITAGQGSSELRQVYEVYDKARLYVSKWAWREGFKDARSADNEADVALEGFDALGRGRPVMLFGGQPVDTDGTQYQRDWDYGDLVEARYRDVDAKVMVDSLTLKIDASGETITTGLRVVSSSLNDNDNIQGGWIPVAPE